MRNKDELAAVQRIFSLANGRAADAFKGLVHAADHGNAVAAATVADWRISGDVVRRDLAEAARFYRRAAELGMDEAMPFTIALLGNAATGDARDWNAALSLLRQRARRDPLARRQVALLDAMDLTDQGDPANPADMVAHSEDPPIWRIASFLTHAEARYVIERANPLMEPSLVVHPTTGQMVQDPVRRAHSMSFPFVLEDPVIHAINRRIMGALAVPFSHGEPLQVLRYHPGEEYRLHSDALPPGGSQREWTFLVWLNESFTGGETWFPALPAGLRGQCGDAVIFRNIDATGAALASARHAGQPVTSGTKLLLSKWVRDRPLDFSGPAGRPF